MSSPSVQDSIQPELERAWRENGPILRGAMDCSDFKAGWDAAMKAALRAQTEDLVAVLGGANLEGKMKSSGTASSNLG